MLGWCPPPSLQNRPSSGSSCLPQSHEIVHYSTFNGEKPVLQSPHQIVIGFDLDSSKSLHTQASESPRSVLEPHRPQSGSPRSPLSALGSLLTDRACVGSNGLQAEEFAADVHSYQNALKSEHPTCGVERVGTYNTSDSLALSKHNCVRAPNNHTRERQSLFSTFREVCAFRRSDTILSSDDEDDCDDCDLDISNSIFSAASPVTHHSLFNDQTMDFLSKCFRCRRRLVEGKDIYMYRGDQAFCSQECRYKQIVADERKHRSPVVTPCFSRVTSDHRTVARATQAAFA